MTLLYLLPLFGLLAVAYCNVCHTEDGPGALTCGNYTAMSCTTVDYIPYCLRDPSSSGSSSNNGICTCERFCVEVSECTGHCPRHYVHVCAEVYTNSVEMICRCRHR